MIATAGTPDRGFRPALGMAPIAAALFGGWAALDGAALKFGAVGMGIAMLATAAFRFCPLDAVPGAKTLGVMTCRG